MEVRAKRTSILLDRDEGIRANTTMDTLASLAPAFAKDGVLTAGNSKPKKTSGEQA